MSAWTIRPKDYFERISLDIESFERELMLPNVAEVKKIIPLRQMKDIISAPIPIGREILSHLLRNLKTLDGRRPFPDAEITMLRMDPRQLKIGQRFVYRENYIGLLESIPNVFHRFLFTNGGLSDLGAFFVFGKDGEGEYSLACYIPPIVEKIDGEYAIMDGIHRNYVVMQAGATILAVVVKNVALPFPCRPHDWSEIEVIPLTEKPENIADRYFELEKGLFRDLKYLGIDG